MNLKDNKPHTNYKIKHKIKEKYMTTLFMDLDTIFFGLDVGDS
jgi:hypothetical protein